MGTLYCLNSEWGIFALNDFKQILGVPRATERKKQPSGASPRWAGGEAHRCRPANEGAPARGPLTGLGQWDSRRAIAGKGVREELAQEALCCEPFQLLTFPRASCPWPSKRHTPKSSGDLIKSAVLDPRHSDGLLRASSAEPGTGRAV